MRIESIISSRAAEPVGPYPHAKRVGNLLFVSGIGPRRRGSSEIPGVTLSPEGRIIDHDITVQCLSVIENLRAIVEQAGSRWEHIVDVTVFLTHLKRDWAAYNKVFAEHFAGPGKPNPTRTTVEVTGLPTPIAVEMKVIAVMPEEQP